MNAVLQSASCFHCGLPVPAGAHWNVVIDDVPRAMCCPGCEAVAQTIVDIGQSSYYRERAEYADNASETAMLPPELRLYSNDDVQFARDADSCEATLSVVGIRCAACVWLIERQLLRLPGVQAASLNVATERLYVRWSKQQCAPGDILQAVRQVGYTAYPYDAVRHGQQLQQASKTLGRQLFVAGLSMMQVMMYVAPAYLAEDGTLDDNMASLMRWASLLLTLPAICYSAMPFFQGAWSSLRARTLGMDVPVSLGILAAFFGSVVATFTGRGEVYFDSATMFIFLLLCSRYFELQARRKAASALERLQHALPASASLLASFPDSRAATLVPAGSLAVGDIILVKPGEAIAADSVIVEGTSALDLSLLTGESAAQRRKAGERVPGGAINASAALILRVLKPARDSTLSDLLKLIERAGSGKPQIALWADKVAAWFVLGLLLFAAAVFAFWHWHDPAQAWPVAIAVLVVSCPCALSLATPTALAAATDSLLRRGVLIVQPHVLETLHRATHIVFDKTGTLTVGRPVLQQIEALASMTQDECLQVAAALEAGSAHPLAQAILDAAGEPRCHAEQLQEVQGQGLEGVVDGVRYRLGNAAFVAAIAGPPLGDTAIGVQGKTPLYLGLQGQWLAHFLLSDALRPEAQEVINYFHKRGKQVVLLSGDQEALTQSVAAQLGIATACGECLPDEKLDFVQQLQAQGAVVAMVGDGINDAAVLSAADVSFAMGSGAALAQAHADTVLLSSQLRSVQDTAKTAARSMSIIRENLGWATLYNVTAIPAAALDFLNPWLSGVGMAASSAVVIANALRLRKS
ncbi:MULTISPECIES: heavy metal translocating P-type ATPase [unclassified Janthinobacterium]|uniref:heavy metal translocating P-type ATPase n=1 Tax=unclassified Janthinobacterium TaxID=2610881 RepID=UPI0016119A26|nr:MULTISPECIES: heavy metal translocating P-type ATPase [unclassified Janthinobacterium]MBB5371465.1 Cu2+-exporting ATPase [Janthinobacterium sp. K2C7]MBB5384271.1 Cu2+-exporting ATPase [Janthinobacterium sp. K2Li3]MBB5389546.1 Cu2+-exporting ATPase [Janthinobacterium sp. K2E3]